MPEKAKLLPILKDSKASWLKIMHKKVTEKKDLIMIKEI